MTLPPLATRHSPLAIPHMNKTVDFGARAQ